ncbi:MAG: phosphodiester glycosidase family protein [Candidatus Kerfeldbacteria bacterium]|nr:phosphodiester glycosidase family protein [Candidatus Kerfeldbacteria bacterium]
MKRSLLISFAVVVVGLALWTASAAAASPTAGIFSSTGGRLVSFPTVAPGSSVAVGDIDGDGASEVVVGSPPGVVATVTVYRLDATKVRSLIPYGTSVKVGLNVAVGDILGDAQSEIVVAPRRGAGPHVVTYRGNGEKTGPGFFAYAKTFRGGVNLTIGDVTGDGRRDIVTSAAPGGGPHVQWFSPSGIRLGNMFTWEKEFRNGLSVGTFDADANGVDDVVTVPQTNHTADVRINRPNDAFLLQQFRTFGGFQGGASLAVNRIDGPPRLLLGAGAGGGAQVLQYDPTTGLIAGINMFPIGKIWRGGVMAVPIDYNNDGQAEIFASAGAITLSADLLAYYTSRYTEASVTGSSYELKNVATSVGTFAVHVLKVNLDTPNLRVLTVTATPGDCADNCPVHPLQYYVDQAQGFAGINGSYFCPADYASCANQDGSTYWMWFNSLTKTFVNSYQNQFNTGPLLSFDSTNTPRLYDQSKQFPGLASFESTYNTKLRALLSNAPLLVKGGSYVVRTNELDSKQLTVKSSRSGIGLRGRTLYFFVAKGATVPDLGRVADSLGLDTAINLDGGGSSALTYNGSYKVGPGRNIPNAIVLTVK